MKLKECFSTQKIGDQYFLICTDSSLLQGMIKLNASGAFVVELLKEDTTEEEMLNKMKEKYSGNEEFMKEDITKIVKVLTKVKALE